jgi:hypothetical protein
LASLFILLLPAQAQPVSPSEQLPLGGALQSGMLPLSRGERSNGMQTDLLMGRNTRGPYLLGWKNFRPQSEIIERDGLRLRRDIDYTIQPETGTVNFAVPLRAGQLVRVSYDCDTPNAVSNTNPTPLPLDFTLVGQGQNRILFRSLLKPGETNGLQAQSMLQLSNGMRFLPNATASSDFYLDLRGGDWLGRSGLRLMEATRLRNANLGFSYTRAGAQFAYQGLTGLTPGREILELTGNYTGMPGLSFQSLYRQTTQLLDPATRSADSPSTGPVTRELGGLVHYALPKNQGSLEAGRTETTTTTQDGDVSQTRDTFRVSRPIAPGTQASLGYEAVVAQPTGTDNAQGRSYNQNTTLNIQSRPIPQVNVQGQFRNTVSTSGAQDQANVRLEATPFQKMPSLRLTANWEDRFLPNGSRRSRDAIVLLPTLPFAQTQISGGFRQMSGPDASRTEGILNASLRPYRSLELTANARFRDGLEPDFVNGYTLRAIFSPLRNLRLTGNLQWNPEAGDWNVRRTEAQTIGLETDWGLFSLRAQLGVDDQYLLGRTSRMTDLALAFRLSRYDTLTTQFRGNWLSAQTPDAMTSYLLSYTRNFGSAFNFSLSGSITFLNRPGIAERERNEMRGEAKLGVRF